MLGTFYYNEQRLGGASDVSSHLKAQRLNWSLGEGDAWSAFSGLSLKLFPVFLLTHMHGCTRTCTLSEGQRCLPQACTHFGIHIHEQTYTFAA